MEPNIPTNSEPQIPIQPIVLPVQPTIEPIHASAEQNFGSTKKSLPKWPLIIAGVILLATLLTGTYLLGKKQGINQKPALKTAQTAALTVTPTSTPDPTANWKTYSSDFFGISLKYPSEWSQLRHDTTPVGNSKYELTEVGIKNGISLTVELQENNNFKNSEDYLNFPSPINASEKILLPDGTPAHFSSQFNEGPMPQKGYWTYLMFFKNGKTYTFYIVDPKNSQEQLMKTIMPTLKLTSQASNTEAFITTPTASWKSFASQKYGFNIKFPTDLNSEEFLTPFYIVHFKRINAATGENSFYDLLANPDTFIAKDPAAYDWLSADTVNSFIAMQSNETKQVGTIIFTKKPDITVAGLLGTVINVKTTDDNSDQYRVFVKHSGNMYMLVNNLSGDQTNFNEFVSTLKFN